MGLEARLGALLATPLAELIALHGATIAANHALRFGSRVQIFAPLYLSSACLNDCVYCGFRLSRRTKRVSLGVDRAVEEAWRLAERGHRTLDLVAGEIPHDAFVDYAGRVCALILERTPVRTVNMNLGALSVAQYRRLVSAGASAYHLYQETYDPLVYRAVHRRGQKRDMAHRLDGAQRALAAGFRGVGLGVLLGLAPVRADLAGLARHARRLMSAFPAAHLGFSLPRIRGAHQEPGAFREEPLDDETFAKALLFLRLEFPGAHLTLTTRESPALRDRLLPLGITKISAGVSTLPGGYGDSAGRGAQQFAIRDERSLAEIAERIRQLGLVPGLG
jgi:2-iminoacetate synthase